ncbi:MAG: CDP-glucose 4,6-dehydratase [Prosthecobacter sp.]|nr:CDP-glucose 4,6-dehydratase [Prosthecobacter sp.]
MENLVLNHADQRIIMFGDTYNGLKVLVTGHTGFKGSWLCEWLLLLGAKVSGYALDPPTSPALYDELRLAERMNDNRHDIMDAAQVAAWVQREQPDLVFHLAAQSLVRTSYDAPIATFATNALGTAHILEAVRQSDRPCPVVVITTDKCYHNKEWLYGYREEDRLGGHDPYSASKACAELIVSSYQRSFGSTPGFAVCSARAGNVIGGGDWAENRIVPDCMRALSQSAEIEIRNPAQTRPWQHVLEPLSGYLWLGALLCQPGLLAHSDSRAFQSAFNFGPRIEANRPVRELADEILKSWPGSWRHLQQASAPHEAGLLNLAIDKAHHVLSWEPVWDFSEAVSCTTAWYRTHFGAPGGEAEQVRQDILQYVSDAAQMGLRWTEDSAR